jgi:hypothetical protein
MAQEAVTKALTFFSHENNTSSYENKKPQSHTHLNCKGALGCLRHSGRGQRIHLR